MRRRAATPVAVVLAVVVASCSVPFVGGSSDTPDGVDVADGWSVEVVRDDLDGPSQLSLGPDGRTVVVAELAGGEGAGQGRVRDLGVDGGTDDPILLLEDLLTPTGVVAASPTALYVQEQRTLSAVDLEGDPPFAPSRPPTGAVREVISEDLPFNGRSQGTVTPTGEGAVLHVATGTGSGPDPAEGSGVLYAWRAGDDDGGSVPVAVGFKNAYAHAIGPDGDLYVTEIGDGTYDGEAPPGELNVVPADTWRGALAGGEPSMVAGRAARVTATRHRSSASRPRRAPSCRRRWRCSRHARHPPRWP